MRTDMAKVIVERPRRGSSMPSRKKGYVRSQQRYKVSELPVREPMLGRWHGMQRTLNEHLGPMKRFLRSQVGRPWNKVHQDLCEHVSFDNAVQKHVLTHVFDFVHQHVELKNGVVVQRDRWRTDRSLWAGEMYVCPVTGLLKVVRKNRRRSPPQRIMIGPFKQYLFRDGIWWELTLRKRPDDPGELWDVWLERDVANLAKTEFVQAYGGNLIALAKRPLRPTEVKQLHRDLRKRNRLSSATRSVSPSGQNGLTDSGC